MAFAPDGKAIVSSGDSCWPGVGEDGLSVVFDLASGQKHPLASAHPGQVRALAFSPDGPTLATAGRDHLIRL